MSTCFNGFNGFYGDTIKNEMMPNQRLAEEQNNY